MKFQMNELSFIMIIPFGGLLTFRQNYCQPISLYLGLGERYSTSLHGIMDCFDSGTWFVY